MARNRVISSLVIAGVLAASVSTSAVAGDRHGRSSNKGAAIAAGIIGGVIIGSLIANAQSAPAPQPQAYYQPQPQTYYQGQPQTYYSRAPQGYYGAPRYVEPHSSVTYVEGEYRERRAHRHYRQHEYPRYYSH